MSKFCDIMIGVCIGVGLVAIGSWVHQSLSDPTYVAWSARKREMLAYSNTAPNYDASVVMIFAELPTNVVVRFNVFHGTDSEPWRFWEGDYPVW